MTTVFGILIVTLGLAIAGFILSFAIWLIRNYQVSFPIWIVLSSVASAVAVQVFAEESAMIVYHMTDVKGIPADVMAFRLMVLRVASALLDGTSKFLITLVGISEIISLLDLTSNKPTGFWRRFKMKRKKNIRFGVAAVVTGVLSTSVVGIYFHTL
ncbi:hypothetical protein [Pelagicoccus mobilis]|uniref:Uncharacterized protein n=1 Tax=Pelagicoccus mobilis TaxID=415221 RepID=A0A934S2N3_9BACT|nr:hypothetical protein [Pelagicoccus mobilis]MBK1880753.1 hypothetical protein [Pelagicoccus mobilis]